jgi:intracellular septation protein A
MQEVTRDAIVSITLFAAVFGMVYVFLITRHRERMTMLEKNINYPFPVSNFNNITLKTGMLLVGLAIGFLILFVLDECGVHSDLISVSMVCLFGGLSLIASYIMVEKKNKQQLK